MELVSGGVRAVVEPAFGGRLTSLTFDGLEVLGRSGDAATPASIGIGCYPMVPWAGRVGGGRLGDVVLPTEPEGHALHGLGRDAVWTDRGDGVLTARLAEPWPEPGVARLAYAVRDDGLDITLTWQPDVDTGLGCALGLHPWFARTIDGVEAQPDVRPLVMVERGDDHLPTGRLVDPVDPPWDDCFQVAAAPVITWPGRLSLELGGDAAWWVVYTGDPGAVCVEPQTVPPDSWAHPDLVERRPSSLAFSITRR